MSGTMDTGLNAMPVVGLVKNAIEMMRGRDFFPDRYPVGRYPVTEGRRVSER